MLNPEFLQELFDPFHLLAASQAHHLQNCQDVFRSCHLAKDGWLLWQISQAQPRAKIHGQLRNILAGERNSPRLGSFQSDNHIEGRGLPRSVSAQ
jgi:hypothetical protein